MPRDPVHVDPSIARADHEVLEEYVQLRAEQLRRRRRRLRLRIAFTLFAATGLALLLLGGLQ